MRKTLVALFSFLLVSSVIGAKPAAAQGGAGVISGRVTDSAGAVLQGARIEVEPRVASTVTGMQGEFSIAGVAPGAYTVTVSYVGFASYTGKVSVTAGQIARVDATLKVATGSEEIMVYAERQHGEAEAINRERTSDNILQVLPVEVITSLPNTNVADALGRLPSVTLERDEGEGKYVQIRGTEPRLSNVTVNGVNVPSPQGSVRQIKLDVMPANLVESVEINKTLSANQDGDAIGGSVNLVTKTAGEQPTLYLNGMGGYTPIEGGRSLNEFDGTIGKRFGASKKLGILIGGSYDWNGRGIDDVEPSITAQDFGGTVGVQPFAPAIDLREYRYYRTRFGTAGSIDYKLGDLSGLYLRGIYSHFNNFGDRWVYSPEIGSAVSPTQGAADGDVGFNSQIRRPVEVIGSVQAGGRHVFPRWLLTYDFSVSRASSEDKGYSTAKFSGPQNVTFGLDRTDPLRPKLIPQNPTNIFDPTTYSLSSMEVSRAYSPQVNLQGGFSAARNYSFGGHFGTLEFGGKLRSAHKFEDANDFVFNADGPGASTSPNALLMTNFLGTFRNPDYYDKSYALGPLTDFGKIRSFFNQNQGSFFTEDFNATAQNTFPNNYDLIERVSAGYVMNTIDFGRVRLQTGVRFEATNEDIVGNTVQFDTNGDFVSTNPQKVHNSYLDVLPSVQARFRLGQDSAIRAVYGRGIARPNFGDLPPFFNEDASANTVAIGNPKLKPTHANNFDLLFEQYLKPLGLLQAGFFYKQLSDPIYSIKSVIAPGDPRFPVNFVGSELDSSINGSSAHLYGFEISYQQHLTFLPGALGGLGISANYGYTNSLTNGIPNRSDKPTLQRQAPNTWNVSPTYDRGRLSIRVGLSHNDANLFQYNFSDLNPDGSPNPPLLGKKGPSGDVYLYSHTQVDAQGSFRMYRGLQLIVSGLNLNNEVFGFYQGSPQFPIQREFYKPSYSFGLRYTLSNEPK